MSSQIKDEYRTDHLKFTDLHGGRHLTVCTDLLEEESFTRACLTVHPSALVDPGSDMAMVPDANTAWVDPFTGTKP